MTNYFDTLTEEEKKLLEQELYNQVIEMQKQNKIVNDYRFDEIKMEELIRKVRNGYSEGYCLRIGKEVNG